MVSLIFVRETPFVWGEVSIFFRAAPLTLYPPPWTTYDPPLHLTSLLWPDLGKPRWAKIDDFVQTSFFLHPLSLSENGTNLLFTIFHVYIHVCVPTTEKCSDLIARHQIHEEFYMTHVWIFIQRHVVHHYYVWCFVHLVELPKLGNVTDGYTDQPMQTNWQVRVKCLGLGWGFWLKIEIYDNVGKHRSPYFCQEQFHGSMKCENVCTTFI